jgi:hypothetical protein
MRNDHTTSTGHETPTSEGPGLKFDFEEFTDIPQSIGTMPYASLYPNGQLRLNLKAVMDLGNPPTVILFFDPQRQVIGVRANYNEDLKHAARVRQHGPHHFAVPVTRFLNHHDIRPAYTIRFLDTHVEDRTLILDLNRTVRVRSTHAIAPMRAAAEAKAAEKPKKRRGAY